MVNKQNDGSEDLNLEESGRIYKVKSGQKIYCGELISEEMHGMLLSAREQEAVGTSAVFPVYIDSLGYCQEFGRDARLFNKKMYVINRLEDKSVRATIRITEYNFLTRVGFNDLVVNVPAGGQRMLGCSQGIRKLTYTYEVVGAQ